MASVVIGSEDGESRAQLVAVADGGQCCQCRPRCHSLGSFPYWLSRCRCRPVVSSVVIGSEDGERPLLVASVGRVPR